MPAFLGLILLAAVLIEPWIIRRKLIPRLLARLRGTEPPPIDVGTVAIEAPRTHGTNLAATEFSTRGLRWWLTQREAAAVIFMVLLWLLGFWLRPDFWGGLDNSFNLLLAFTEIGLMAVGMSYVMANGDVDLSVGAVLALSGSTAAFLMKFMGWDPLPAGLGGFAAGLLAGCVNGLLATRLLLPAFVATLGMFYVARGIAAWLVAGRQLSQFPESYNLIGRKLIEILQASWASIRRRAACGSTWPAPSRRRASCWCVLALVAGDRPGQDPHRLHGVRDRRQPPRRRVCRHRHRQGAVLEPRLQFRLRLARRPDLHRLFPLLQPVGRAAARARRDRRGDHRRRLDLRRLRLDRGRARRVPP